MKLNYPILFGPLESQLPKILAQLEFTQLIVVVDTQTKSHCFDKFDWEKLLGFHPNAIVIPAGEENKNLANCQKIWDQMFGFELDRSALVINLGGGMICDLGGMAASSYKRGIRFIHIPTSLLAMVDASIGGKVGFDYQGIKNALGFFNNPEAVCIDTDFLKTLPSRELNAGYAEMVKHGWVRDESYLHKLTSQSPKTIENWDPLILRSVEIKKEIVLSDYKETGIRTILNFGHTIGHALESFSLQTAHTLLHGEAVAAGMVAALSLSQQRTGLNKKWFTEAKTWWKDLYDFTPFLVHQKEALYELVKQDKKRRGEQILFTLLEAPAKPIQKVAVSKEEIYSVLDLFV